MEDGPPLLFRFQVDEVFGVKEAGVIGSVVRTPHLAGALRHFGKGAQHDSRLVRDPDPLVRAGAGRKRAANPECAFVEVRQEFGTDDAAESQVSREDHQEHARTYGDHDDGESPSAAPRGIVRSRKS